ncbi:uncharacterized protein BHQ10_007687 [Talaromyces amestolkiae]|uniref:histone acetyltransferase n=1 Tax=Talaromyces amestolkiae TaxID=1196081 RepID=A0A364L779_TALAM|nr:uncharacterized protein BHQ10_007687 [Talaromyces amestolkiae]RAO71675.1 hypothetical protein BHQ10_007687 [Talaromyces amestolkiae]
MATQPRLEDLLAEVLPSGLQLNVRHVSTTPTRCDAIFSAPPGQEPEITFCESHFYVVTVNKNRQDDVVDDEVAVLGVEVYVYTTDRLTTLFVSKADSTGYVHLTTASQATTAATPKVSLLRLLTTTFIRFLARSYQRLGVRLVLSLFARAQNQYLFPGSADNERKHVLDDRGLIKWWCRAADPLLREHAAESRQTSEEDGNVESVKSSATAYLLVPGCDQYETRAFFPPTVRSDENQHHPRWRVSYPLSQICSHPDAPPRCLVPRFPDDPKARFLDDLDDELPSSSSSGGGDGSSETDKKPGHWRSVRSLEMFWEMMSFRQECSAGRLVGFLWLVINPPGLRSTDKLVSQGAAALTVDTKEKTPPEEDELAPATTSAEAKFDDRSLPGLQHEKIQPPTSALDAGRSAFYWPEIGRGEIILSEEDYKIANDVLLDQDFETEELAIKGTMAWIRKVASVADVLWWGVKVTGRKKVTETTQPAAPAQTIDSGLIVRKRKKEVEPTPTTTSVEAEPSDRNGTDKPLDTSKDGGVNVLNASFVRKKKKT